MFELQPSVTKNRLSLFSGIFAKEIPFHFLHILTNAMWSTLMNLISIVAVKYRPTDAQFIQLYQKCLNTIQNWCPKTKRQEMSQLMLKYPYIEYFYEYTYFQCLKTIIKSKSGRLKKRYTVPDIGDFVYLFFVRASRDPRIQNIEFQNYTLDQVMFLFSTILRNVFFECIDYITLPSRAEVDEEPRLGSAMALTEKNLNQFNEDVGPCPVGYPHSRLSAAQNNAAMSQGLEQLKSFQELPDPPQSECNNSIRGDTEESPTSVVRLVLRSDKEEEEEEEEEEEVIPATTPLLVDHLPHFPGAIALLENSVSLVENEVNAIEILSET